MPASKNKSLLSRYTAYTVLPSIAHAASRSMHIILVMQYLQSHLINPKDLNIYSKIT